MDAGVKTVKCMVCGREFAKACSLGTHLWKTHGLKPQQYYDAYVKTERDGKCAECGAPTRFRSISVGYAEFCSKVCAARHIAADASRNVHKVDAMRHTVEERYGVENAACIESVKEKRKKTMLGRYGVEHYSQHDDYRGRLRDTMLSRYGVNGAFDLKHVRDRLMQSNMDRYGVPFYFMKRSADAVNAYSAILKEHGCTLLEYGGKKSITFSCGKCGGICTEQDLFIKMRSSIGSTPCSCCIPKDIHPSIAENALADYVRSLGFDVGHYDRGFLGQYGADIVVEARKVVIEYDGVRWHSELYRPADYHLTKTEIGESMGYRVVHVFSDEWELKQSIVKSRIAHILGVSGGERIYARKCMVCNVDDSEARRFLDDNHIQGACPSAVRLGLRYGGRLVALMTFGKSRFEADRNELLRYCTLADTSVVGGAGRLLAEYRRLAGTLDGLVSYADRRYSSVDAFYEKVGFTRVGTTHPNYSYEVRGVRRNRMAYQKHKLVADNADHPEYSGMSEHEIMLSRGIYRVYDCGNVKYVWRENKLLLNS